MLRDELDSGRPEADLLDGAWDVLGAACSVGKALLAGVEDVSKVRTFPHFEPNVVRGLGNMDPTPREDAASPEATVGVPTFARELAKPAGFANKGVDDELVVFAFPVFVPCGV